MTARRSKSVLPTPAEYFGHEIGEDRKLADWPRIVDYFHLLDAGSDRIQVQEVGKSTEGEPFLMAVIAAPETLADLEEYRAIQAKLADPRTVKDEAEAAALIAKGKAVILVTCSVHGTEVGATQMSTLLAHHLCTSDDPEVRRILDNVIFLLVPCLNPDGLRIVKKWYDSTLGTWYEGVNQPFLYHKYVGHDNNRDWYMFTQQENRLAVEHAHNAWHPHVVYDLHQMGPRGPRLFVPPYLDPIDSNVDPILQSEIASMGTAMFSELTGQRKAGVAVYCIYDAYTPSRAYQHYHGGIRILSEAASVRIATPVEVNADEMTFARGIDPRQQTWNNPMPWQGGRWTLRDIVDYEYAAVMACLGNVARYRDVWLQNFYAIGVKAVQGSKKPYAYLVPRAQRDPVTAHELLDILRFAMVEVHEAEEEFEAAGVRYPAGTRVVLTAQPYGAFAKTMLEVQHYPDLREYPEGPPKRPYDVTAHSLPLQMGVDAVEVREPFKAKLQRAGRHRAAGGRRGLSRRRQGHGAPAGRRDERQLPSGEPPPVGRRSRQPGAGVVRRRGASLRPRRLRHRGRAHPRRNNQGRGPGDGRRVRGGVRGASGPRRVAPQPPCRALQELGPDRGGGLDPLDLRRVRASLRHAGRRGSPPGRPQGAVRRHRAAPPASAGPTRRQQRTGVSGSLRRRPGRPGQRKPPRVRGAGRHQSWRGTEQLSTPSTTWTCPSPTCWRACPPPSSTLRAPSCASCSTRTTPSPTACPPATSVMFERSPAFNVRRGTVVGRYPLSNLLLSGWVLGQERLYDRAALAEVPVGDGRVVLIGFKVHFRAQARGTYRILFNSLLSSAAG